jgi:hypothetical protein
LRDELASSSTAPSTIAARFAAKANCNASHNTYLASYSTEALHRAEQLPQLFPQIFSDERSRPPLYGVPISIKDCFDVAGTVTTCGSRFYAQHNPVATKNSWVAQRLLDSGAILTGKTHLHQLAYGLTGENADYGDPSHRRLLQRRRSQHPGGLGTRSHRHRHRRLHSHPRGSLRPRRLPHLPQHRTRRRALGRRLSPRANLRHHRSHLPRPSRRPCPRQRHLRHYPSPLANQCSHRLPSQ